MDDDEWDWPCTRWVWGLFKDMWRQFKAIFE